jgi:predicted CoA-binding protein
MSKKTLVIGASDNPSRYSYLAVQSLVRHSHPVMALGIHEGKVGGEKDFDTVTLYLNPTHQRDYYDYILSLKPSRIIFNPGAENPELASRASAQGIEALEACTLVLLSTGQY